MVLDLELRAQCGNYSIVDIGTIICDDSFRDTGPTNEILFDELGHKVLGNRIE